MLSHFTALEAPTVLSFRRDSWAGWPWRTKPRWAAGRFSGVLLRPPNQAGDAVPPKGCMSSRVRWVSGTVQSCPSNAPHHLKIQATSRHWRRKRGPASTREDLFPSSLLGDPGKGRLGSRPSLPQGTEGSFPPASRGSGSRSSSLEVWH